MPQSVLSADQVVGDQTEEKVFSDAAVFGLPHCVVLFAPAEEAFDHLAPRLRHSVPSVPLGASADCPLAVVAGFGVGIVLHDMWCHAELVERGHIVFRVIGLVPCDTDGCRGRSW